MNIIRIQTLVAAALIWALTLCALATLPVANAKGVKLLMSWKNLDYSGAKPHRILIIGMSDNTQVRVDVEDYLSSAMLKAALEAVPGYSILFRTHSAELDRDYLQGPIS